MYLGHPFLIYGLCQKARVPLEDNETWIHPIKATVVKKKKSGIPRPEEVYDSGHEPSNEEELKAYQTSFGIREDEKERRVNHPPTLHPYHSYHPHHMRRMIPVLLTP